MCSKTRGMNIEIVLFLALSTSPFYLGRYSFFYISWMIKSEIQTSVQLLVYFSRDVQYNDTTGWIFFSKKVWPFHQSGTLISGRGWSREPQSRTRRGPSLLLSIGTRSQDTRLSGGGIGLEREDSHQQPWRSIVELSSRLFFCLPDSCCNMCHFGQ